jgi:hypothetical protein
MAILKIMDKRRFFLVLLGAWCMVFFTLDHARAQSRSATEYQVKAAFIYNFTKFIEWPEGTFDNATAPVILCVAPSNPLTEIFSSLNNMTVGGRKIEVRFCNDISDIKKCHILFLASFDKTFIKERLEISQDKGILTIGEAKEFSQLGGIINFFIEKGRLRFEFNLEASRNAGLKVGSQLLMSAEIVQPSSNNTYTP